MANKGMDSYELEQKAEGKMQLKNQNPNQSHNIKKQALGRNTAK